MAKYTTLNSLFTAIADSIRTKKGITDGSKIIADNFPDEIAEIETGIDTTISFNAATASDIRTNKKAYVNGSLITGNFAGIDTTISSNAATASDILYGKKAYVNGSQVTGGISTRSYSDIWSSGLTVYGPIGYYPNGIQMSVSDANLIPSNIKSGVSIFGVTGDYVDSQKIALLPMNIVTRPLSNHSIQVQLAEIGSYKDSMGYIIFTCPLVSEGSVFYAIYCNYDNTMLLYKRGTSIGQLTFVTKVETVTGSIEIACNNDSYPFATSYDYNVIVIAK